MHVVKYSSVFVKTSWKQLPLKMESTQRLRSSDSVCWLTELPEGLARSWMAVSAMNQWMGLKCQSEFLFSREASLLLLGKKN